MASIQSYSDVVESALAANNLNWSTIADRLLPIVWYDVGRDDPTAIVQVVERVTELEYQGEKGCPHDTVAGLRFANPDDTLPCGYCENEIPATEVRVLPDALQCPVCGCTAFGR